MDASIKHQLAAALQPTGAHNGQDSLDEKLVAELALALGGARLASGALAAAAAAFAAAATQIAEPGLRAVLADRLLALAKAWDKRGKDDASARGAEQALLLAAEALPARGVPALAQFLQRRNRAAEA